MVAVFILSLLSCFLLPIFLTLKQHEKDQLLFLEGSLYLESILEDFDFSCLKDKITKVLKSKTFKGETFYFTFKPFLINKYGVKVVATFKWGKQRCYTLTRYYFLN